MGETILVEPDKCTGCRVCEMVCSFTRLENIFNPSRSAIRVIKKEEFGIDLPVLCMHCRDPICSDVCPMGAIRKGEDNIVKIDDSLCRGCKACIMVCPYGAIRLLDEKMVKCDLCSGDPMCVKWCPTGAIKYVKADSPEMLTGKKTIGYLVKAVLDSR